MIINNKQISIVFMFLSIFVDAMDQPSTRKNKPKEQTQQPKKRAARGSKQFGTLISDIKIVQPGPTQFESEPSEQEKLNYVKARLSLHATGTALSPFDFQIIDQALHTLAFSKNKDIKAEAFLILADLSLYGWGRTQNFTEAYRLYNEAARLETPFTPRANYFKEISVFLKQIEPILYKKSLILTQKLQDIHRMLEKSPYYADQLVNNLILSRAKQIYPESNPVENALAIGSPAAKIIVQNLLTRYPEYQNDAIRLIKLALFANDTTLLKNIYNYTPELKIIIEQLLEAAIRNDQYHDIEILIKSGISKEHALTLAHRLYKAEVIDWLNAQSSMAPQTAESYPQRYAGRQATFTVAPSSGAPLLAPTIQIDPNIPVNDQFITAVKKQKSSALLEALLEAGAEINYVDELSNNALIEAIQNKDAHLVKWLLDRGADSLLVVYEDENLRVTPDYAARLEKNAHAEIIKLIEDAQINKLKILSSPLKPAAAPASSPRKVIPFKGF